jgi:superfamily II DNA helicase RecQ
LANESTLTILPTGKGKSLIYQFISLFLKNLTLIISPLISLMIDQIAHIPKVLTAACFHSKQTHADREGIVNLVKNK